jgi:prolyl-tRNA editing enzyme YbaK/EbsC (Cys-tRNA(Pro) deacylase)
MTRPFPLYHAIMALLRERGIPHEHYEHEHVHGSEDAAKIRGTTLEEAAKAIVLSTKGGRIIMCVVSGHRRIDLKALKAIIGEKNISLASPDAVLTAIGCPIGSVPPFGNLCSPAIPVYCDADVLAREHLVFSAGSHFHSVRMTSADWVSLVQPVVADFGKEKSAAP